ncbi:adenosylmethionine--8-amino-7-oxononanoate aminotransferase BioA [Candidatus Rickettsiella isopodorum]|jgi:adenosylmethionine-8-amino-7-oxononanoate aminotransferase|uniref:Adenosylmethionine-8-amino-7-oxononanoate aminotransferase n=1 Tax=Candidatus Rickettsiella isopodorum TaxID=1225476 RepID=A0A1J8NGY5_9COXI|nr:adenosylmethionine--8-amino-7-oxononanoate transaminase [Candidatus Rickettsiella isopodorum]OIZ94416.1 adenosylmethionine--8-amino-7-oxononanoate aminotransferase BioA [Candidatus Rickettsiella isopodorum]
MDLINRDRQHIWHPCSQMKDYESFPPLIISKAYGSYIELTDGRRIIDAISSWWCKSLGHNHPRLKTALKAQLEYFEHVIFANTTYEIIIQLSEKLGRLCMGLDKVFYASEGSSAVEIALKMSLHAQQLLGQNQRIQFTSLQNGYHGETFMALGLSDLGLYRQAYEAHLIKPNFIQNIPYVHSSSDPLWKDCSTIWPNIEKQLEKQAANLAAIIVEPIVQGAGGMKIYSQDFLHRLRKWTQIHGIYLIADEIMTGLGRTGRALACEHAQIKPDFICLSKGLTSGWLPMSAVLTHTEIYNLFYDDYSTGKSFLHSHTFSGNALAAAVALECLNILEDEEIFKHVREKEIILKKLMQEVHDETESLTNIRGIGAVIAADLSLKENKKNQRIGYQIFQEALQLGAWLRPLGNTIYWLPPLNISLSTLEELRDITKTSIKRILK